MAVRQVLKKLLILFFAFLMLTAFDVLAWPLNDVKRVGSELYAKWRVAFSFLIIAFAVLVGIANRSIASFVSFLLLSCSGAEDLVFFLIMGWPLPSHLPWLDDALLVWPKPVRPVSCWFGLAWASSVAIVLHVLEALWRRRRREDALWEHFW